MPLRGEKPPHFGRSLLMRPAPCPACWWPSLPGILSSNMKLMHTHAPLLCTNALPSSWFCLQSTNSFCNAHAQACLGTHGACIFCNSHTLHVQQSIFAHINIFEVPWIFPKQTFLRIKLDRWKWEYSLLCVQLKHSSQVATNHHSPL